MIWFLLFLNLSSQAQIKSPHLVSLSLTSIKKCFPALADSRFENQVDLRLLKEKIDVQFLTMKSNLKYRRLTYQDGSDLKRLTIRAKVPLTPVMETEMLLEKIDEKGSASELEIPVKLRKNPTQGDINTFTMNNEIKSDEIARVDTKINGAIFTWTERFLQIEELELRDSQAHRTLTCENQKNLGVVCTCK